MRRHVKESYSTITGKTIKEIFEPADFGGGYYHYIYEIGGGVENLVCLEYIDSGIDMGVVDERTRKKFGTTPTQELWSKAIIEQASPTLTGTGILTGTGKVISTTRTENWGGGAGGAGSTYISEVIPYREGGFNNTIQEIPPAIFTYTFPVMVSTGCSVCDKLVKVNVAEGFEQDMYESWYRHYMEADRRTDEDLLGYHLDFVMNHMLKYVSEDTKDVVLTEDHKVHVREASMVSMSFRWTAIFTFFNLILLVHLAPFMEAVPIAAIIGSIAGTGMAYLRRGDIKEENRLQIAAKGGKQK